MRFSLLVLLLLRCIPRQHNFCLGPPNNKAPEQHLKVSQGPRHQQLKDPCGPVLLLLLLAVAARGYGSNDVGVEVLHQSLLSQELKWSSRHCLVFF